MGKRLWAVLLAAWLCLSLSGCSFAAFDSKNLMAPPKANADQQAIHELLQGSSPDVTFVYPKSGEYRSAIIMRDFTGDGKDNAIGFYSLGDAGGVEVQFLEKTGTGWRTDAAFKNMANQVDRVCFADLTGDGVEDVLIGWGSAAGTTGRTAAVNAYIYDGNGGVNEHVLGIYGEMALTDLDGDGISEVFTVDKFVAAEQEGDEPSPAKARLYAWQGDAMAEICSTDADNSISIYSAIFSGSITSSLQGVVLDGAKADGSLTTQVFYLEDGKLVNSPPEVNMEDHINPFSRSASAPFLSRDINGDGIVEIPTASLLPGIPEDVVPDSTSFLVKWNAFHKKLLGRPVMTALMNLTENYWFRLPAGLEGQITASNDPDRRSVTYTQVTKPNEEGQQFLGAPLFSIRVFTRSAWDSRGQSGGYELLAAQADTIYGIQIFTEDEQMLRYIHRIRQDFKLITE